MDGAHLLDELLYCLNEGFPASLTTAMLTIAGDETTLQEAWDAWKVVYYAQRPEDFISAVGEMTSVQCMFCDCGRLVWVDDDTTTVANGDRVCDAVCLHNYSSCYNCDEYHYDDSVIYVSGRTYCDGCRDNDCTYCEECEEWFLDSANHDHGCDCAPPHARFSFPADGHGTVRQNERLTVELPKGTIDDEGISRITRLLQKSIPDPYIAAAIVGEVGPIWQAKRGNFTRRLSSAFHARGVKLAAGVVSEIGNLARAHSSDAADWHVEFTRDLNESAEHFYHGESCWWGSHSESRCCLKNWGGLALRTFTDVDDEHPSGRAWVQPLGADMCPTHDTVGARAYVIYNGYGDLSGYTAPRLVAHLTSRSYRKIGFCAEYQYVNGEVGYLVADEATCTETETIGFCYDPHYTFSDHVYYLEAA